MLAQTIQGQDATVCERPKTVGWKQSLIIVGGQQAQRPTKPRRCVAGRRVEKESIIEVEFGNGTKDG
jgi:hypothetical protein